MNVSSWARLWIVAPLLGGCYVENPEPTRAMHYTERMAEECDRFLANVRKPFEVQSDDPVIQREWTAITSMTKACLDLQNDMKRFGTD